MTNKILQIRRKKTKVLLPLRDYDTVVYTQEDTQVIID